MLGRPVRLAIASPHEIVAHGLRSMLAPQAHRVLVADEEVDVVLHDRIGGADPVTLQRLAAGRSVAVLVLADVFSDGASTRQPLVPGAVGWVPLGASVEEIGLIALGLTNQDIVDRMFISIDAVGFPGPPGKLELLGGSIA